MLFFCFRSFAQVGFCSSDAAATGLQPYHTGNVSMDFQSQPPLVLGIYFVNNEPEDDVTLTEGHYLKAIAYLNITFNQFNIFFKYSGYDDNREVFTYFDDVLNLQIEDGTHPGLYLDANRIYVGEHSFTDDVERPRIVHEVGHALGLCHTFHGTHEIETDDDEELYFTNPPTCNGQPVPTGEFPDFLIDPHPSASENVTRDSTDPDYNATTAGDLVADTAAAYRFANACNDPVSGTSTYLYSPEVVDATGTPYENVNTHNFMSYNDQLYLNEFTPGQGIRMRETIENEQDLIQRTTTVEALYQPYKNAYYGAGPTVYPDNYPLFQPGFDYSFVQCGQEPVFTVYNEPTRYDYTSFNFNSNNIILAIGKLEDDYSTITHPNHSAIIIEQIDADQPRHCYNNYNRSAIGGQITRFNDGVFNTNTTTTNKNAQQINDPDMVDGLDNGLYSIEKYYDDGDTDQRIIIKDYN